MPSAGAADPGISYGHARLIAGQASQPFQYTYNLGDFQTSITYPSGRVVTYTPTGANRVGQVSGSKGGTSTTYASAIAYAPHGALSAMSYGTATPVTQSWKYNPRLQTTEIWAQRSGSTLLKLTLGYGGLDNNGNVQSQVVETGTKTYQQSYGYDSANRIASYQETTLGIPGEARTQSYGYDGFGNSWRTAQANVPSGAWVPSGSGWFDLSGTTTNRMNGMTYDAAGNLTQLSPYTGEYDAENRLRRLKQGEVIQASYEYDGQGRRVKRTVGTVSTHYVYDADGNLMAEYGGAAGASGTRYLVTDALGSTRLVVDGAGNCVQRTDYLPFGMEMPRLEPCYGGDPPAELAGVAQKFTGKERDGETVSSANPSGLDYFGARYLSGAMGRFTSADEPFVDQHVEDPQSWNLYSYVRNNPLIFTDPTGNDCVYANSGFTDVKSISSELNSTQCGKTSGYWVDGTVTQARFAHGSLILTGTTDGANRTSAAYALGPDPGLEALISGTQRAEVLIKDAAKTMAVNAAMTATGVVAIRSLGYMAQAAQELGVFKNTKVLVNFAHQLMKVRPGHLPPPGSEAQVQQAVEGAVQTGNYVLKANGLIEGTTQLNGVAVGFRGRFVDGVARIATVFTKR